MGSRIIKEIIIETIGFGSNLKSDSKMQEVEVELTKWFFWWNSPENGNWKGLCRTKECYIGGQVTTKVI